VPRPSAVTCLISFNLCFGHTHFTQRGLHWATATQQVEGQSQVQTAVFYLQVPAVCDSAPSCQRRSLNFSPSCKLKCPWGPAGMREARPRNGCGESDMWPISREQYLMTPTQCCHRVTRIHGNQMLVFHKKPKAHILNIEKSFKVEKKSTWPKTKH
jgi:hypothetical protein